MQLRGASSETSATSGLSQVREYYRADPGLLSMIDVTGECDEKSRRSLFLSSAVGHGVEIAFNEA